MKIMPFGKHKGTSITEIPISYLQWAVKNLDSPELVAALEKELEMRYDEGDLDLAFDDEYVKMCENGWIPSEESERGDR